MDERVIELYFNWLLDLICDTQKQRISYSKLLIKLYNTEFEWINDRDANSADYGIDLRNRFCYEYCYNHYICEETLVGPCNILELLVSLSLKCDDIMAENHEEGLGKWFWMMIDNLQLNSETDKNIDFKYVEHRLEVFMKRKYNPDGTGGGLFCIKNTAEDLRKVDLWYQLCWFLDDILGFNERR